MRSAVEIILISLIFITLQLHADAMHRLDLRMAKLEGITLVVSP